MAGLLELDLKSLDGKAVGEKFKIVNTIVKKAWNHEYVQSEVDKFLRSWNHTDYHVITVYISLVNFRKKSEIVVRLLQSEKDLLVMRTISTCTFFWLCEEHTPDFYVENIFPFLSFSNRNRLLKAIAKNLNDEERAQNYFDYFKKMYGLQTAKPFLTYCHTAFIMNMLLKQRVVLTLRGIKALFAKNPEFIQDYLRNLYSSKERDYRIAKLVDSMDHNALIQFVFPINTVFVLNLIDEHKKWLCLNRFGIKCSNRILRINKEIVLNDPKYYSSILNRSVLYKSLSSQEYEKFYKGIFPKKMSEYVDARENLLSYLDYYKTKAEKLDLLLNTYRDVYGQDLLENPRNLTSDVMKLLDVERRVKFAKEKIANKGNSDIYEWTCYLTCNESIPIFKEQIRFTPVNHERGQFLKYMVLSCHINDDMSSMLEVLKYFNERHRNEDFSVKSDFAHAIVDYMDLEKFTVKHWEQIKEFVTVLILNKQVRCTYILKELFTEPMKYNLKRGLSIVEPALNYLKYQSVQYGSNELNIFTENSSYEKKCLLTFGELMPKVVYEDNHNKVFTFMSAISSWNKRHFTDTMSITDFNWAIECISLIFKSVNDYEKEIILREFKHDKRAVTYFYDELKEMELGMEFLDLEIAIKLNPYLLMKNIKTIFGNCSRHYFLKSSVLPLMKSGKIMKEFKEAIKGLCLNTMQDDGDKNLKPAAIRLLSYCLTADEFYAIIKPFYPEDSRLCLDAEGVDDTFEIQKSIACALKSYANHTETFVALKKFCVGDYLKLTVGSLNSVCIKTPFYKTVEFLNSCIDTPVSFKKHIIRLLCCISDKVSLTKTLKDMWEKEKHYSIHQILLENIYNYFIEEPNDKLWSYLKCIVESLSVEDKHGLRAILKFENVPESYLSKYVHLTWTAVTRVQAEDVELKSYKTTILNGILDLIPFISDSLIEEFMRKEIFNSENRVLMSSFAYLAAQYILEGSNTKIQETRINFIISEMKTAVENFWNTVDRTVETGWDDQGYPSYITRRSVNDFIETVCSLSVCHEKYSKRSEFALSKLLNSLESVFDPSLFVYKSYVTVHLTIMFKQSDNLVEFGKHIRVFLDKEIAVKGAYVIKVFADILTSFLKLIDQDDTLEVADGLLSEPLQFVGCAYLAMNIAPLEKIFEPENQNILTRLSKIDDGIVKSVLNMYN